MKKASYNSAAVALMNGPLSHCFRGLLNAQWKVAVHVLSEALNREFTKGVKIAAEVASDYDKYNSHPSLVSDCILGKLNVLKRKPRKNKAAAEVNALISSIEKKIDSIEGRTRFIYGMQKWEKRAGKK